MEHFIIHAIVKFQSSSSGFNIKHKLNELNDDNEKKVFGIIF